MTTETTVTPVDTYKAARAEGKGTGDATLAVCRAHGLSVPDAAEVSWTVETGGPAPAWLDSYGCQTKASRDYDRGMVRKLTGR